MVGKAAKGRLSAHIQQFICSNYLGQSGTCYRQSMKLTNRIAASIYICKEECLSVCLFFMRWDTVQPNAIKFCS
jgi:hypothetical protein